ncbi:hypothetical protein ACWAUC_10715 [Bradyrhizobium guangdongense]
MTLKSSHVCGDRRTIREASDTIYLVFCCGLHCHAEAPIREFFFCPCASFLPEQTAGIGEPIDIKHVPRKLAKRTQNASLNQIRTAAAIFCALPFGTYRLSRTADPARSP